MSHLEQNRAFVIELQAVVDRFREEFDLSTAAAIGCIEMVKLGLFQDAIADDN